MTIVQQLAKATAELEAANRLADEKSQIIADLEKQLAVSQEAVKQAEAQLAQAKADGEKALAEAKAASEAALAKSAQELANECAAHGKTKADLEKAHLALKNPAFADAAARGESAGTPEGGAAAGAVMTYKQAIEAYNKIEGARERADFRAAHAAELRLT